MVHPVSRLLLTAEAWVLLEGIPSMMWWKKCDILIGFLLITSVLHCQYYSAHAVYSSSSNITHTRRTNCQILETFKNKKGLNIWSPDTLTKVIIIYRGVVI